MNVYEIKTDPLEQAEIAQLARLHRLATLINHRCPDQEIEISARKDAILVDIFTVQHPFGPKDRIRRFGYYDGVNECPNGGLDEAQRWLEGFAEVSLKEEKHADSH